MLHFEARFIHTVSGDERIETIEALTFEEGAAKAYTFRLIVLGRPWAWKIAHIKEVWQPKRDSQSV
jgi:hypothetical protein